MMRVMMMFNVMMTETNMFMTMEMMTIDQDIKCPERMYWVHFDTNTEICQQSDTRLPKTRNVHLDEI